MLAGYAKFIKIWHTLWSVVRRSFTQARKAWLSAVAFLAPLGLTAYLATTNYSQNRIALQLARYLFVISIIVVSSLTGQTVGLLCAIACASIFLPMLVGAWRTTGLSPITGDLFSVILFYFVFAVLTAALVSFEQQRERVTKLVQRLSDVVAQSFVLEPLLRFVLEQAVQLCDADGGAMVVLPAHGPGTAVTIEHGVVQTETVAREQPPARRTLRDWLMYRDRTVQLVDLGDDARFAVPTDLARQRIALIAAPIRKNHTLTGLVALWRYDDRRFNRTETDIVSLIADKSKSAIENAWLTTHTDQVLARQARERALLLEASNAFAAARDLENLLTVLSWRLVESAECTACQIYLLDATNSFLSVCAHAGVRPSFAPTTPTLPLDQLPLHSQTLARGEPSVVSKTSTQLDAREQDWVLPPGIESALLMPLTVKGHPLGLATLYEARTPTRATFTEEKIALCKSMAQQGALAIENILTFKAIADQTQRIQLIIDNVADGVFSTDLDGRILNCNPAVEKITGYSAAELIGKRCADIFQASSEDGESLCEAQCPLRQLADTTQPQPIQRKEWISHRDGARVFVAHSVAPFFDVNGIVTGAVSVLRDVSREEELIRLKSDFISMVSHQLRTPLTHIRASADLLARGDLDSTAQQATLASLIRQCAHLTGLVNQVLTAARLEKGRLELTREPIALEPLIRQTLNVYHGQESACTFRVDCAPQAQVAWGDRASVEIILENLIQNALDHSPNGGMITIAARPRNAFVQLSVVDQGSGIPADELPHIFERYYRSTQSENRQGKGFGLGLFIAKSLVEAQGGTIWAESLPGQGACFHFTLARWEAS